MKVNADVWKEPTELPDPNIKLGECASDLVFYVDGQRYNGFFSPTEKQFCDYCGGIYPRIDKWCYLDDAIKTLQTHTELQERNRELEKLLSYAVHKIREIKDHNENGLLNGGGLYTSSEPFDQIIEKLTTPQPKDAGNE